MKHYQICFTRLSGQESKDGWQAVNASEGLTQTTIASFTRFQNGNITPPVFDKEDMQDQMVTELQSDGEHVFYTMIKCNAAADDRGRSIMFAHSFVFDAEEFILVPQAVLGLSKANFKFDVASTCTMPQALDVCEHVTLPECIRTLGLSGHNYNTLIKCVYSVLDGKANNSLHIVCDCKSDTIRRYMTCIYMALPYEFRRKISFSTYDFNNGVTKTIIFDRPGKSEGVYYLIPETEENNILTESFKKRFSKYEFLCAVPNNYDSGFDGDSYFKALESKLALFGSARTTVFELYKIADDLIKYDQAGEMNVTAEARCVRLNELLSAPIRHVYVDQLIVNVLSEIIKSNVELNDVLFEKLCRKLEITQSSELRHVGCLYIFVKLVHMNIEDAAKYLFSAYTNRASETFVQLKQILNENEKGCMILNRFYAEHVAGATSAAYEDIRSLYNETAGLAMKTDALLSSINQKVLLYAKKCSQEGLSPDEYMERVNALSSEVLVGQPEVKARIDAAAKKYYWESFDYTGLDLKAPGHYNAVLIDNDAICAAIKGAYELTRSFVRDNAVYFGQQAFAESRLLDDCLPGKAGGIVKSKIIAECVDYKYRIDNLNLDIWINLAMAFRDRIGSSVEFMFNNEIAPMCVYFAQAYDRSYLLKADDNVREQFTLELSEYIARKTEYAKVATEALHIVKEGTRGIKQEQKRLQREERSNSKNSAPMGLGKLLRKKKNDASDDGNDGRWKN